MFLLASLLAISSAKKFGVEEVPSDYSFDDESADHTKAGIAFDEGKKPKHAVKAFEAAVKFAPTANTYSNLVSWRNPDLIVSGLLWLFINVTVPGWRLRLVVDPLGCGLHAWRSI